MTAGTAEAVLFESVGKKPESRLKKFWPDVGDIHGAAEATRLGMWAAVIVAVATTAGTVINGLAANAGALVDVVVFMVIAWGLKRYSRVAALGGFSGSW